MKEEPVGCEKESLMIIKVVSKVLDHLIAGAKTPPPSNLGLFVKFQSSYAPEVSVQSYLERIRKYSRCSDACFVMALIYIDRLIECRQLMLTQLNVHRLLVTCVMVAAKFHDDLFYNNSYYAKLGGLPLPELNLLEIDLLKLMNFTLFIDKDAYANYFQELKKYFFGLDQVPSPVSVATAGSNVNASFHAAPAAPMAAVGGGGLVKSSVSCPNFANVIASASSGVEDYRVPTPRNPHDKAGSVNVSNEYYFGGYASTLSNTSVVPGVQDLHSSSESPEFVDGNPYVDYDSPYRAYGGVSYAGEGDEEYPAADHFAQKGHQHSCDNVASVMPLYLSPQPGCAPVRQLDRQTSSWHRSAALMVHEDCGGVEGLSVDTSSCDYDERVYSVYHQQQVDLLAAARQQHLQLQQQQQQMLARHRAAYGYGVEPTLGGGGYYTNGSAAPYGQSVSGHWMNHHHHHQQQQHLYSHQSQGYEGAGYVDMPNVVDIHGHYHGSFAMHTAAASAPYVTVGGPGGRYHTYQRQHSA